MSTKPSVTDITNRFETDLSPATLQLMINAAHEEVTTGYGYDSQQVDLLDGMGRILYLSRQADSITSIVETIGDTDTTLAANDYTVRERGWALKRIDTGTNGRQSWGTEVKVTYVPEIDRRRFGVVIDLVILEAQYKGLSVERDGDYRADHFADHHRAKLALLRTLGNAQRMVA